MNFLKQFFYGRNGFDLLNKIIIFVGALFLFCSSAFDMAPLAFGFLASLIFCMYRAMSTDLKARQTENRAALKWVNSIAVFFRLHARVFKERKTHKYMRCKKCGTLLRVPKGKGKISIKCSKCGESFIRKV